MQPLQPATLNIVAVLQQPLPVFTPQASVLPKTLSQDLLIIPGNTISIASARPLYDLIISCWRGSLRPSRQLACQSAGRLDPGPALLQIRHF